MKVMKRLLTVVLALAMVIGSFSLEGFAVTAKAAPTISKSLDLTVSQGKDSNYTFPVTMYKYEKDVINEGNTFKFMSGDGTDVNKYQGEKPLTGLVKSELDENGLPVFGCTMANSIFDLSNKNSAGETTKYVYQNVDFPFYYDDETGYYTFNSRYQNACFSGASTSGSIDWTNVDYSNTSMIWRKEGTYNYSWSADCNVNKGNSHGFYPFNDSDNIYDPDTYNQSNPYWNAHKDNITQYPKAIYHYGMNMSLDFYMTSDGKDSKGNDIKFAFAGDDDVWIFVDGKLVLDLGGIHDEVTGSINFADGTTYVNGELKENLYTSENSAGLLKETQASFVSKEGAHTIKIFYLERGKVAANLMMHFNLPQRPVLAVTKQIANYSMLTSKQQEEVDNTSFEFTLEKKNDDGTFQAVSGQPKYQLQNAQGQTVEFGTATVAGTFTLKAGQIARFYDLKPGTYRVKENGYTDAQWQVPGDSSNKGETSAEFEFKQENKTFKVTCINDCSTKLKDDVVVLDYGKKIVIDVAANDILSGAEVADLTPTTAEENREGTFSLQDGRKGIITYQLNKYMDQIEKATYGAKTGDEQVKDSSGQPMTATVTVIPATTVYYEDDFGTKTEVTSDDGTVSIVYSGGITFSGGTISQEISANKGSDTQDDGTVGKGNNYGYDSSYSTDDGFSYGSAYKMVSSQTKNGIAKAEFTFKGTGFDIIGRTSGETGIVQVDVYGVDADGEETWLDSDVRNTLYQDGTIDQIPVFTRDNFECFEDNTYGTYKVVIQVSVPNILTNNSTFYIDAIRIYDPIDPNSEDASEANAAYKKDAEYRSDIREIRELLLTAADTTRISTGDAVFVPAKTKVTIGSAVSATSYGESVTLPAGTYAVLGTAENDYVVATVSNKDTYKLTLPEGTMVDYLGKDTVLDNATEVSISEADAGTLFQQIYNIVYVDTMQDGVKDFSTYNNIGPSNETYLKKGQEVIFGLSDTDTKTPSSVQVGMKAPSGSVTARIQITRDRMTEEAGIENGTIAYETRNGVTITKQYLENGVNESFNITVSSATDRYYDLTDYLLIPKMTDKVITIENVSENNEGILSLTTLKVTYLDDQVSATESAVSTARLSMSSTMLGMAMTVLRQSSEEDGKTEDSDITVPTEPAEPDKPVVPNDKETSDNTSDKNTDNTKVTLSAPVISKVSSAAYNKIKVQWKKVQNASGYEVYRATSANGTYKKVGTVTGGSKVSFTDSKSVKTGVKYYYKVRAYKTGSKTVYSALSKAKSAKAALKAPVLKQVKSSGSKKVTVKWSKVSGANGYVIYRSVKKNGTYKAVKTIKKGSIVSFTDKKLTSKKTYYYKVKAYRTVNGKKVFSSFSGRKSVKAK